jgi:hypothetical protein
VNVILAIALLGALVLGLPAAAADEVRPTTEPAGTEEAKASAPAASGPTLLVAGTILAPPRKAAVVVTLDQDGRETGSVQVDEGDTVDGYRVTAVEPDRVSFEGFGQTFTVRLGGPPPAAATGAPSTPTEATPTAIPTRERARGGRAPAVTGALSRGSAAVGQDRSPPPNAAELREKVQPLLDALREHPRFRQKLEQVRPLIRQRLEERRAAGADPREGSQDFPRRPPASE